MSFKKRSIIISYFLNQEERDVDWQRITTSYLA
jgi:hypothetical protein